MAPQLSMAARGNNARTSHTAASPRTGRINHTTPTRSTSDMFSTTATNSTPSRKSEHLLAQLAGDNFGPLGPAGCEGVPDQMGQGTLSNHTSHHYSEVGGSFPASRGGNPVPTSKASSGGIPSLQRSIYKSSIPCEEKMALIGLLSI